MRHRLFILAVVCMTALYSFSQNKSAGINLSIWKGASTQPLESKQTTYFNLGLFSAMNRLNGVGVNVMASAVMRNMNGIQLSGIGNMVGNHMNGIQVGGLANVNGSNMSGVSLSGLVNVNGNNAHGVSVTGLANVCGDGSKGIFAGGVINVTTGSSEGVQLAGVSNILSGNFDGLMLAGLLNVSGGTVNGLQISPLGNITTEQMNGIQLGIGNFANRATGLQIGLVNYYREQLDGFQLGLINANPNTRTQLMLFGGNATKINIAVRFKNDLFYTILGTGAYYLDFSDKFSASVGYRCGMWLPVYKGLSVSGDLGYQHIATFKNKDNGIPSHLYALQARLNLEYQLTNKCSIFVTGGYGGSRYYNKDATYKKGMIAEAGIILF